VILNRGEDARYRGLLQASAAVMTLTAPVWLYFLLRAGGDTSTAWDWSLVLLLMGFAFGLMAFVSRSDPFLRRVMTVGLLCKMMACAASVYLATSVYSGSSDAVGYTYAGRGIAGRFFEGGGHWTTLYPVWSTNFVRMLTGALFIVTGPSMAMGTIVFALVAFCGQYLSYRAFCSAFPAAQADRRFAAMLLFLLPSLIFWSAGIGKDALMAFFIGLTCYGYARLDRTSRPSFYLPVLIGVGGVLMVRPHVALMLVIALCFPFLLAKNTRGARGVMIRAVGIPLLLGATVYVAIMAKDFLAMDDYSQSSRVIERVNRHNQFGGSVIEGDATSASRVLNAPFLFFRPFPWEVHNLQAAIASSEGMLLLIICFRNRRHILAAVWRWRSTPFTIFILVFLVEFTLIFSAAISNFGLLARERIMGTPLLLMLMCVPAGDEAPRKRRDAARSESWPERTPEPAHVLRDARI
jgi:hypothetical protein